MDSRDRALREVTSGRNLRQASSRPTRAWCRRRTACRSCPTLTSTSVRRAPGRSRGPTVYSKSALCCSLSAPASQRPFIILGIFGLGSGVRRRQRAPPGRCRSCPGTAEALPAAQGGH
jgi:hypothetical protein